MNLYESCDGKRLVLVSGIVFPWSPGDLEKKKRVVDEISKKIIQNERREKTRG